MSQAPTVKSARELEAMRAAGRIAAEAMQRVRDALEPGMTTADLDAVVRETIEENDAKPAFLGYMGFPGVACTSINEEIVHGIPGGRVINDGDLVKIDLGAIVNGYYSDHAVSMVAGRSSDEKERLIEVTRGALSEAIRAAEAGWRIGDISAAIEGFVLPKGYELVREYVGHGIGRRLHEGPQVPNVGKAGQGPVLRAGMTLAIEPMVNVGGWETKTLDDKWTVVTADGTLSAHFEHTIVITDNGAEVLTSV